MKKAVLFTVADQNNQRYAKQLENSLRKFHPESEIDFKLFTEADVGEKINYYRQKPMFARELLKEYELVIGADSDQIITGDLNYLLTEEYDLGAVLNFNRVDPKKYGYVSCFNIPPNEYMNAGLVALRSLKLAEHWWRLCNSRYFETLQYREQDILNILVHYGDYKIECFDFPNKAKDYHAWHGLIAKGEYNKVIMRDGKMILPKAQDKYPEHDKEIKVLHTAGGGNEKKINDSYKIYFNEEVSEYIDSLIK